MVIIQKYIDLYFNKSIIKCVANAIQTSQNFCLTILTIFCENDLVVSVRFKHFNRDDYEYTNR